MQAKGIRFFLFILFVSVHSVSGQDASVDSSFKTVDLGEVVVTATRTGQKSSRLPVPVTIIKGEEISSSGFSRLSDVFGELNGAAIVDYFGSGLQLRGLDPAYTLILIDGEPVIGRNSGTYDLAKISVNNIERIEVVRGPVSALYGSEALAGAINIITKKARQGLSAETKLSYGSNHTAEAAASLSYARNRLAAHVHADGFHTSGYDLDKATLYRSGSKNLNGTIHGKGTYQLSDKLLLSLQTRYYREQISNKDRFAGDNGMQDFDMADHTKEFSVTPSIKYFYSNSASLSLSNYFTLYDYQSRLNYSSDGRLYYDDRFRHLLEKPELIFDKRIKDNIQLTTGAGYIGESVSTTRYAGHITQQTFFLFLQAQVTMLRKITLISGGRLDRSEIYGTHFSPKVSAQYLFTEKLKLSAGWGTGFKSPDFRQLYLNFANQAIGYSVFGSEEIQVQLSQLQQNGQIESIFSNQSELGKLKPEKANSMDLIFEAGPWKKMTFTMNFFRNDITDLIETKAVAQKTNGQFVYSYLNLSRVFTQGLQADVKCEIVTGLSASLGYQYLEAKDKRVLDELRDGKIYARDPQTLYSYKVAPDEYGGLFNRSAHSGTAKINYRNERTKSQVSVRYVYRSRFGLADKNGNQILDADNEYVDGYGLVNLTLAKEFSNSINVYGTVNNLFGYTSPELIPSNAGRTFLVTLQLNFNKQINEKKNNSNL